jgi:hypothetical protein
MSYLVALKNRVLLNKLMSLQLAKQVPEFYGIRKFINAFTKLCHFSLSSARVIHIHASNLISLSSFLILFPTYI